MGSSLNILMLRCLAIMAFSSLWLRGIPGRESTKYLGDIDTVVSYQLRSSHSLHDFTGLEVKQLHRVPRCSKVGAANASQSQMLDFAAV